MPGGTSREAGGISSFAVLSLAKTTLQMVIHHARRLHESVHDGGADELEPPRLQVLRQRIRYFGSRRNRRRIPVPVPNGLAVHVLPQKGRKAAVLLLQREDAFRVDHRRLDLE